MQGTKVDSGPEFPSYYDRQWSFHLPIIFDATPKGEQFGSVKTDVNTNTTYKIVG